MRFTQATTSCELGFDGLFVRLEKAPRSHTARVSPTCQDLRVKVSENVQQGILKQKCAWKDSLLTNDTRSNVVLEISAQRRAAIGNGCKVARYAHVNIPHLPGIHFEEGH
ncbi:hypothetical protein RRF57_006864 [Xylaria bambusicola]|uniref:Uncharacterized protein n=1 Tax=Xylaria bambusicola TaxID=326684 RepID=A0AAN7UPN6_9PEZI